MKLDQTRKYKLTHTPLHFRSTTLGRRFYSISNRQIHLSPVSNAQRPLLSLPVFNRYLTVGLVNRSRKSEPSCGR